MSHDPCLAHGRLEHLDDDRSLHGTVATDNYVSYPSYPSVRSDGALSPKLGDFFDSGHAEYHDPALHHDLDGAHMVYEPTTTPPQGYFYPHITKQCATLGSLSSFSHVVATGLESYASITNGLNKNAMSIVGAGILPEKISCVYGGCLKMFTRTADLDRHVLNVHNRVGHHCQVLGCGNNKGNGYCRPDKLKEHMWKKHGLVADLSYTKAMPSS
jgi:hypothetical protein